LIGCVAFFVKQIDSNLPAESGRSVVRSMIMRETLFLVFVGVGLGLAEAIPLTNRIQTMLFGINANDPMTVSLAIAVLVGVAALRYE
jgi:hypothetical protein